jgi:uncharacterized protein YdaU (DUF1376 family)
MSAPFYRFFPSDFYAKAGHLSLLEHGAYRQLIDRYMLHAGPLPFDMPKLYRYLHATSKEEQQAVQTVVEEFFRMDGSLLRHARCDAEIAFQRRKSAAAAGSASNRWFKKEQQKHEIECDRNADAMQSECDGNAIQIQIQTQIKDKSKTKGAGPRFALPEWVPLQAWQDWEDSRKKQRKAMTDGARRINLKKLEQLRAAGNDPQAVLDQSTAAGWARLFEVHESKKATESQSRAYI